MGRLIRRRGVVSRGPQRKTTWFQFQPVNQVETALGGTLVFSLNAAALALRPFTIVRTHFEFFLKSDQLAATENYAGAVGLAVVSDQASAIGITAVPTPVTDMGSNLWFAYGLLFGSLGFLNGSGAQELGKSMSIDSKAMRKVEIGQDVVVVVELGISGSGVLFGIGGRMLVKNN